MLKEKQDAIMETEDHICQILYKTQKIELHEYTIEQKAKMIDELKESLDSNARTIKMLTE